MDIGFVGLGKMGKNLVLQMLEHRIEVVAWNRSSEPLDEVVKAGAKRASDLHDMVSQLQSPHTIWLMLPQGSVVDEKIAELIDMLDQGDLIIDGGNSLYTDSLRRAKLLAEKGIHFMDIGVSGGPKGAREGACMMIGGDHGDFERIEPIIKATTAHANAYAYLGSVGAGHFAKMVHNGIEYGMMQAIGEGAAVLNKSNFHYNLAEVFQLYNRRSVIESRLVGWAEEALKEDPELRSISSVINHTGEGEWTVNAAKELQVKVPIIEESYQVRVRSSKEPENFGNKMVSALRGKFGGHAVSK